jgi:nucleoid DNA-binding protein
MYQNPDQTKVNTPLDGQGSISEQTKSASKTGGKRRKKSKDPNLLHKVAKELHNMYDLPRCRHNIYDSPMWTACRAVFKAIEKGLREDGFVSIPGLGRFHTMTRKAHRKFLVEGGGNTGESRLSYWANVPEKKFVVFRPSPSLKKFVNKGVAEDEPQAPQL